MNYFLTIFITAFLLQSCTQLNALLAPVLGVTIEESKKSAGIKACTLINDTNEPIIVMQNADTKPNDVDIVLPGTELTLTKVASHAGRYLWTPFYVKTSQEQNVPFLISDCPGINKEKKRKEIKVSFIKGWQKLASVGYDIIKLKADDASKAKK